MEGPGAEQPVVDKFYGYLNAAEEAWEPLMDSWVNADHADAAAASSKNWTFKAGGATSTTIIIKLETIYPNIEPENFFDFVGDTNSRMKWDSRWVGASMID